MLLRDRFAVLDHLGCDFAGPFIHAEIVIDEAAEGRAFRVSFSHDMRDHDVTDIRVRAWWGDDCVERPLDATHSTAVSALELFVTHEVESYLEGLRDAYVTHHEDLRADYAADYAAESWDL